MDRTATAETRVGMLRRIQILIPTKRRSERRKHCALAVVNEAEPKNFVPGCGTAKI